MNGTTVRTLIASHPKIVTAFVLFAAMVFVPDGAAAAGGLDIGLEPMRHNTNTGP
jgi:hypothetical protein